MKPSAYRPSSSGPTFIDWPSQNAASPQATASWKDGTKTEAVPEIVTTGSSEGLARLPCQRSASKYRTRESYSVRTTVVAADPIVPFRGHTLKTSISVDIDKNQVVPWAYTKTKKFRGTWFRGAKTDIATQKSLRSLYSLKHI